MHLQYFAIAIASLGLQVVSCHFSKVILIHGIQFIREHSDCCPGFILIHPDSASQISSIFFALALGTRSVVSVPLCRWRSYVSTSAPWHSQCPQGRKSAAWKKQLGNEILLYYDFVLFCCESLAFWFGPNTSGATSFQMPAWSCLLASLWKSYRSQAVTGKMQHVMRGGASEEANGPRSPIRIPEK